MQGCQQWDTNSNKNTNTAHTDVHELEETHAEQWTLLFCFWAAFNI